jgi:ribosomal-protein-alanine N-acetyltransferase
MIADDRWARALAALHARLGGPRPWRADEYARLLADPAAGVFGLHRRGRLVGLAVVRVAADEGEILTIGVEPESRGRGHGRRLLAAALDWAGAAGAARIFLEVAHDNAAARSLYRRLGFETAGRRPGYYRTGRRAVDAWILCRTLAASRGPRTATFGSGAAASGPAPETGPAAPADDPVQVLRMRSRCGPSASSAGCSETKERTS